MTNYNAPLFVHPQPVWDEKMCLKHIGQHTAPCGGKFPKGYLSSEIITIGITRYNGGCIRDGKWWQGEDFPMPIVPKGFSIVPLVSWGWQLIRA